MKNLTSCARVSSRFGINEITVKAWDDLYPYKKIFLLQGFYELAAQGVISFSLEPYSFFEGHGAPVIEGPHYNSHKNIVVLEVAIQDRVIKIVYDSNDIYYKIPAALLNWCDLYFKSNYQEAYLQTGNLLKSAYWDSLPFLPELIQQKFDVSCIGKMRKASFTMDLYGSFRTNRRYLSDMDGLWFRQPLLLKKADVFFLGRYWQDTKGQTIALLDAIQELGLMMLGGIVLALEDPPERFRRYTHPSVSLRRWCEMASRARVPLITRGLQGCVGFKPLNLLMIGAPIIANRFTSNLWQPLVEGVNYIAVKDDFSDLREKLETCTSDVLLGMAHANHAHWRKCASPTATALYLIREARALAAV